MKKRVLRAAAGNRKPATTPRTHKASSPANSGRQKNRQPTVAIKQQGVKNRTEETLRQSHAFIESMLEHLPNMVFAKDAQDLRFIRFNKAGEELLGYSRSELLGKNDYDFFPKQEADFFTAKDREVLAGGCLLDIPEEPIQTRHKGERLLHTKKIPICDAKGETNLPAPLSSPNRAVVCHNAHEICFDRFGPSIGLTEVFLGQTAAQRLTATLREHPGEQSPGARFSLDPGVDCVRETGPCRVAGDPHAGLTMALFGPWLPRAAQGAEA